MKHQAQIKWINVNKGGDGVNCIQPVGKYLIIAGQLADFSVVLNAENILVAPPDEKYLDRLSAESDLFTRLLFFTSKSIDMSNMRSGTTVVGNFRSVQIIEYLEVE